MENKVMAIARTAVYIAQRDVPNLEKARAVNMLIKIGYITRDEGIDLIREYTQPRYSNETAIKK